MAQQDRSSVVVASLLMVIITLALFFLPLINGLVGGAIGGYKVGNWKRALTAAILPAIVATVAIWLIIAAFGAPVLGLFGGLAVGFIVILADVGIFIGAALGGWAAQSRLRHRAAA
jgi:hypothetical protein